jgi:hypothetical protein
MHAEHTYLSNGVHKQRNDRSISEKHTRDILWTTRSATGLRETYSLLSTGRHRRGWTQVYRSVILMLLVHLPPDYHHTQTADRLYLCAEQRGILDFVFKLFGVSSFWFCRKDVSVILIRVQNPATRT